LLPTTLKKRNDFNMELADQAACAEQFAMALLY